MWEEVMASWKGNIFRVNGPVLGESTGHRWIPTKMASDAEPWFFFGLRLNERLSKQLRRRGDLISQYVHYDVIVMIQHVPFTVKPQMKAVLPLAISIAALSDGCRYAGSWFVARNNLVIRYLVSQRMGQSSRMDARTSDMSDVFCKCLTFDNQKALLF